MSEAGTTLPPDSPRLAKLRELLKLRAEMAQRALDDELTHRYVDEVPESDDEQFRRLMDTPAAWDR